MSLATKSEEEKRSAQGEENRSRFRDRCCSTFKGIACDWVGAKRGDDGVVEYVFEFLVELSEMDAHGFSRIAGAKVVGGEDSTDIVDVTGVHRFHAGNGINEMRKIRCINHRSWDHGGSPKTESDGGFEKRIGFLRAIPEIDECFFGTGQSVDVEIEAVVGGSRTNRETRGDASLGNVFRQT